MRIYLCAFKCFHLLNKYSSFRYLAFISETYQKLYEHEIDAALKYGEQTMLPLRDPILSDRQGGLGQHLIQKRA